MKKLFVISLMIILLSAACSKQNKTEKSVHKISHLTAETFKKKIFNYEESKEWKFEGKLPAIVDFYADWCAPCKIVAPIFEELSKEYEGKIDIYKIDTDSEKKLASIFQIRSIPSILFIPLDGKPTMTQGARSKEEFKKIIEENLLNSKEFSTQNID